LAFTKPSDGPPIFEDNPTTHAAEFEEREKSAISNRAAKLRAPTYVAVGGKLVGGLEMRRYSVLISLNVR
jgi:hypothetical protein